ncbi:hypothetical protein D9756_011438 [Leucocoprinus leucothites]|uniref:galacturonan 1,4-alpha-galacturonidase n=1 Tax=Leucocoprinus leucothites TaxID=201217 RepID=A0A8H5CN59_9AGAR|nr:hypothetical protein D9756_011438 [Leucoagaricus leucothites]
MSEGETKMLALSLLFFLTSHLISVVHSAECTVARSGTEDDSPAILKAFTDCQVDSTITFSQANYSAFTPFAYWLEERDLFVETYATPWFYFEGEEVSIIGSDDPEWGAFHGFGEQWWNVGNRILRPQLATFNVTNGLLRKLKVIKPIAWVGTYPGEICVSRTISSMQRLITERATTLLVSLLIRLNLSGHNITVDGYYGHNGDDCVSVINGGKDIVAQNGYCGFSSHGLSIGSLGKAFKSWTGGQGFADNVTWRYHTRWRFDWHIRYPKDKGARPQNTNHTSTKVSNFLFKNFTGSLAANWTDGTCISNPCWNFVEASTILKHHLRPLPWDSVEDINIHPMNKSSNATTVICDPNALASGEQDTLGFQCNTGPFAVTEIKPSSGAVKTAGSKAVVALVSVSALVLGSLLH